MPASTPSRPAATLEWPQSVAPVPTAGAPQSRPTPKPQIQSTGLPADDYYSKRARALLGSDAPSVAPTRWLQSSYPNHSVVYCEAGCYGTMRRLVQITPIQAMSVAAPAAPSNELLTTAGAMPPDSADPKRASTPPTTGAAMQASSGTAATAVGSHPAVGSTATASEPAMIECVAGCYGGTRRFDARAAVATVEQVTREIEAFQRAESERATLDGSASGRQIGSVARNSGLTGDGGRWMTTAGRTPSLTVPAAPAASQAHSRRPRVQSGRGWAPSPSGEWFSRINADRKQNGP